MAEHHQPLHTVFFGLGEGPADLRADAKQRKQVGGDECRFDPLRHVCARQRDRVRREQRHVGEEVVLTPPFGEGDVRGRFFVEVALVVVGPEHDQALGIVVWQRPEQHAIDHTEHGAGSPDSQRERADGDAAEDGIVEEHPPAVLDVLPDAFEPRPDPRRPRVLARERHVAQRPAARHIGVVGRQPGLFQALLFHRAMSFEFPGQIGLALTGAQQVGESTHQLAHGPSRFSQSAINPQSAIKSAVRNP